LNLGLGFFQFKQTNLIGADATTTFQNRGNNTSRGIELEALWQATKTLRISGNFTHREDAGSTFNSIPRQKAHVRTDWVFLPRWNWNVQANWISRIDLPLRDPRLPLSAYTLVDSTLRYTPAPNWELVASLRNLLDVDAREYSSSALTNNLPLPGRSFQAEVRHRY
jgi:iron complex outermembrane receptor protein